MVSPLDPKTSGIALDPEKVLAAIGNRIRWQMFRMLAAGTPMHAAAVAREFDRDFDGISKHLRILRSAGLLQSRRAADRRVEQYFVPPEIRRVAGEVELGFCLLRVPEARPDAGKQKPRKQRKSPPPETEEFFEDEPPEDEPPVQGFGEMLVQNTALGSGRNRPND